MAKQGGPHSGAEQTRGAAQTGWGAFGFGTRPDAELAASQTSTAATPQLGAPSADSNPFDSGSEISMPPTGLPAVVQLSIPLGSLSQSEHTAGRQLKDAVRPIVGRVAEILKKLEVGQTVPVVEVGGLAGFEQKQRSGLNMAVIATRMVEDRLLGKLVAALQDQGVLAEEAIHEGFLPKNKGTRFLLSQSIESAPSADWMAPSQSVMKISATAVEPRQSIFESIGNWVGRLRNYWGL
jgi:hypothetical protein